MSSCHPSPVVPLLNFGLTPSSGRFRGYRHPTAAIQYLGLRVLPVSFSVAGPVAGSIVRQFSEKKRPNEQQRFIYMWRSDQLIQREKTKVNELIEARETRAPSGSYLRKGRRACVPVSEAISLVRLVRVSMTNKENYKIADADALFDAVQLYIDSTPPCDQNRLSPRHAVLPRAALSTVQDFVETTIVLRKERNELGISITGGSDTYLVNELSLRDVCSTDAVRALREAPSPVRLMVLRENPQTLFTTTEKRARNHSLTFHVVFFFWRHILLHNPNFTTFFFPSFRNGRGVFITYIQPGSIAARHGRRVMQGDQILEINGTNVRESNQKDVAQMINNLDGAIVLLLGRVPSLSTTIQEWARKKAQQSLRTRTSTWSSYTGNNKEKLQIQRPSSPSETAVFTSFCLSCSPQPSTEQRELRGQSGQLRHLHAGGHQLAQRTGLSVEGSESQLVAATLQAQHRGRRRSTFEWRHKDYLAGRRCGAQCLRCAQHHGHKLLRDGAVSTVSRGQTFRPLFFFFNFSSQQMRQFLCQGFGQSRPLRSL
ncbi:hypothetical protein HPB51_007879 [Rhipicephalus microplus]|uniref:PDZ domain-containing protein n=1 Tax=Rhipicephalus microplus TaxID=6941 RepID=A0A9J6EMA0_RHIMP|nr:hypothetical protein HPB51_007879 [Rhipicephalus microplus]